MNQILIVSGSEHGCEQVQALLKTVGVEADNVCLSGKTAEEYLKQTAYQLVIVNAPLEDEYGELIAKRAYVGHSDVMMIVKEEHADAVREKIQNTGILMLTKPLKKAVFQQAVQCILWHEKHMTQLREEQDKLNAKIQETNLINRAKLLLIQVLRMSESQAHRYIEKQAMDLRVTRREIAEGIINTYEG